MNRKRVPKGKLVRRFGVNIFEVPKYDKLLKAKPHRPGFHGKNKKMRVSEYSKQLDEKQKLKFAYGVSERQFRNIYEKSKRMGGITGNHMLSLLEQRLDNVLFRATWGSTRALTRQLVSHGHIHLNGRVVNIPSVTVRAGDVITVKNSEKSKKLISGYAETSNKTVATWLDCDKSNLSIKIKHLPEREEIPTIAIEQQVVEFYSK